MFNNLKWDQQVTVRFGNKVPIDFLRAFLVKEAVENKKTVRRHMEEGYGTFSEVAPIIEEAGGRLILEEIETDEGIARLYLFDEHLIYVTEYSSSLSISLEGFDEEWMNELLEKLTTKLQIKPPKGCIMMLAQETSSLYLTELGEIDSPLERGNYSEKILKQYDTVVADLRSDSPTGRLTVLDGPPGTGKSFFIRGLITEAEALYVYVPAAIGGHITGPEVIPVFLRERDRNMPIVLVMEDADATIATRQIDNVGRLSDLLNMSDGILGEMADIRILATTNAKKAEIDTAVLREGRINEHITFTDLDDTHAYEIFSRLTGVQDPDHTAVRTIKESAKKNTLASVYSLARQHGWKPVEKRKKRERSYRWTRGLEYHSIAGDL